MLEKMFKLKENNTTAKTEVIAGITTFMTMAYILAVNPNLLSQAGMDPTAVLIATCLASFIGTFAMALLANYPFALAPGMGHPHTAVMDMMWEDGKTVYFLTADFKPLYKRLKEDGRVAVTGMTQGAGTMDRKSISLTGQVEWIGKEHLEELLKANPYMYEIYPTEEGRSHLQVFRFKNSVGNFYDLTQLPPYQARFEIEG